MTTLDKLNTMQAINNIKGKRTHPVGTYMLFGFVGLLFLAGAVANTAKPTTSMPAKPYTAPAGYSDITSAPALVREPPKDTRMTPQQAARVYGFEHCNLKESAKEAGMSERELAAWLIASIKVGIKPC